MATDGRVEFDPKEIARAGFPTAFRGYDQESVRRYLVRLAAAIGQAQSEGSLDPMGPEETAQIRVAELEHDASILRQRIEELEHQARQGHGSAFPRELDEGELIELLGQETARIVASARSAASDIINRAESEAAVTLDQADREASAAVDEATTMLTSARSEAKLLITAAREEADATLAAARDDATTTVSSASAEAEDILHQAETAARKVEAQAGAEADRVRDEASDEAERIRSEATVEAETDVADARRLATRIVADAEASRDEILGDLVRRRRASRAQLDRLADARALLATALASARDDLDEVAADLAEVEVVDIDLSDKVVDAPDDGAEVAELVARLDRDRVAAGDDQGRMDDRPPSRRSMPGPAAGPSPTPPSGRNGTSTNGAGGAGAPLELEDLVSLDADAAAPPTEGPAIPAVAAVPTVSVVPDEPDEPDEPDDSDVPVVPDGDGGVDGVEDGSEQIGSGEIGAPVLGIDSGSLQRRATRGDLPGNTPYVGSVPTEFNGRDIALSRATPGFKRRLKRAVNDDQSHVLDRLRGGRGRISAEELPPLDEQLDCYIDALRPVLLDVVTSGAELLDCLDIPDHAVENLCLQLGKHIVDCLRLPSIDVIEEYGGTDREAILDPVRAIYRDFRNSLLPDLIEDALHEAFALGLYHAIQGGTRVLWKPDPRLDADPICEENSASPALVKGAEFPSGHLRPLSMPGCRCLVVPV